MSVLDCARLSGLRGGDASAKRVTRHQDKTSFQRVDRREGPRPYYILPIVPIASTQSPGTVTLRMSPYQGGNHGRPANLRTNCGEGHQPRTGHAGDRDGETPRRGAVLPGACPSRKSRMRGGLSPVISMPLQIERGLKCGGECSGPRLSISTFSAAPSTPYPREIGPPWCMIRFLNSGLAAAPRGSMFCLSSLLMEQFCLGCSASHYVRMRSKSQETRATTTLGARPESTSLVCYHCHKP